MFYKFLIATGSITCVENILSQRFLYPLFSQSLLNVYLQTFAIIKKPKMRSERKLVGAYYC